ncbi:acetyl-CoA carboxylase [Nitratireductor sp. ZSWI3]|uniref:acetyl-CoA carboxylase n=1 Tax=Nitratireductor sp. ZSWI3 TaxID=2966359 RepID=UPI00214FC5D6|nr:acetyl-CoA carboxylase [Nitratireductor sp. ZSWI3]MCR4268061.1 acetyl-CoA carboxylase [Nitratireductor sp. ZSWI3]
MSKVEIKAPMPGVFYRKPAPDSPPFKADGEDVALGDVVGLIEVMKSFHEITAAVSGKSVRFLLDDAEAIMAGQVIAELEG